MNRFSTEKRAKIIQLLVEGNSLRSTSRIMDCSINTVTKLLVEVGQKCQQYQDEHLRNLPCKTIQVDEIWSFVYAKKPEDGGGDVWTWTSICADTKLIPHWLSGPRESVVAREFMEELCIRIPHRFQLSTDGFRGYRGAVQGLDIDFGRLVKQYAEPQGKRYGAFTGMEKEVFAGDPDVEKISTTYVERNNLTMRQGMKRFARKTNAHSKKLENHKHAVALHFMYYNFVRIHASLKVTPAMAAGISGRLWSLEDIASL